MTGAQQVHDKVLAKVHDDKVRDKVHDTAARGVGGTARHKHAHGTTRHSSLEQMSERRTRAQKGTDVFGGGAQVPPHACRCHPHPCKGDTATTTRRGDDDHVAAKR